MNLQPIKSNMNEVETEKYKILFSYRTPVAIYDKFLGVYFKSLTHFSVTTSRHINQWLRLNLVNPKEVQSLEQSKIDELIEWR